MSETQRPSRRTIVAHVATASAVGVVGGVITGLISSLLFVNANVEVGLSRYGLGYLTAPILVYGVSGTLFMAAMGLLTGLAARVGEARRVEIRPRVEGYVAAYTGFGVAVWLLIGAADLSAKASRVGAVVSPVTAVLGTLIVAALTAAAAGAALTVTKRLGPRTRRGAVIASLCVVGAVTPLLITMLLGEFRGVVNARPASAPASSDAAGSPRVNVLMISIDTLRADRLQQPTDGRDSAMPALEAYARRGVRFSHAVSSSPWTLPSVASLMTGLHPHHHRAGRSEGRPDPLARTPLPEATRTLAEQLRDDGYFTQAIVTNPYLYTHYGLAAGFTGYRNLTVEAESWGLAQRFLPIQLLASVWTSLGFDEGARAVSDNAIAWLGEHAERPFFLWLHYIDPHGPYGALSSKSFRGESLLTAWMAESEGQEHPTPAMARLRAGEVRLSADGKQRLEALYDEGVRFADIEIARVLQTLERVGIADQTLVVVVSDHGEEFWDHGGVEHGHSVYDELVRVPLLFRLPGVLPAGHTVDRVVSTIDVAPTILEIVDAGVPVEPDEFGEFGEFGGLDGRSLVALMHGKEVEPRPALSENLLFAEERIGFRTDRFSYVRWQDGREELYDLQLDPTERLNLVAKSDLLASVRSRYTERFADLDLADSEPHSQGEETELSPFLRSALRSLGYAE